MDRFTALLIGAGPRARGGRGGDLHPGAAAGEVGVRGDSAARTRGRHLATGGRDLGQQLPPGGHEVGLVLYCTVFTVLYCIVIVLYCTVLYCRWDQRSVYQRSWSRKGRNRDRDTTPVRKLSL